ncbi:MAG: helix-turn-helix transcriptional regulator [Gammaproteobacteria bacterium]|jgi:putative transcriptional regulator|nr:helix-turn-helix transcriptional regulator [Gammaproteobacteria bacterium]MCZ6716216.1 helix-turn-helix transcriptional regulator [Gammaproteobacteria bacterium]MCZ6826148.1 helix-turn-helix transcriptional regulator [Gammaproteobacteria bacterium]MCZ6912761.1 helix-turn-helix transcriptional regulator [Pseudomonadota bacterium]
MKNNVRKFRAAMNWTQAELAGALDVSRQTVNAIERERYDPSLPLAFRIAALFDKRAEDVFIVD